MTALVVIWDRPEDPPEGSDIVWGWRSNAESTRVRSVPRYLEANAERLRARYLAFIHDLGQARVAGKRVVEHFDLGDGFSTWWMNLLPGKSPFNSPRIYACLRLLAIEEMLLAERPAALRLVAADVDLAESIERLCAQLRIAFSWERRTPAKGDPKRTAAPVASAFQGLATLARQLKYKWGLRRLAQPEWFAGDDAVFLCSFFIHLDTERFHAGHFYSRHWEMLPHWLHAGGANTNWLHQFFFSPIVPDAREGVRWLRLFNKDAKREGCHAFIDSYLSPGVVWRALRRYAWSVARAWRLRDIDQAFVPIGALVWLWPLLRGDWQSSVVGPFAMANALSLELFDAALGDMPHQPLGLYLFENLPWERALLRAWRRHGHGRIIGVQHATAPFWHLYYFDDPRTLASAGALSVPMPDKVALNGPLAQEEFRRAGFPAGPLVEVEALRYLDLAGADGKPTPASAPAAASRNEGCRVLVVGDMNRLSTHNLLTLVADARTLFPANTRLTFKAHPNNPVNLERYPGLTEQETADALSSILGDFDVVCSAGSTSAALDAFQAGVPVIVHLDGSDLNLSPLRGHPDARFVGSREELAAALDAACRAGRQPARRDAFFFMDPNLPRWRRVLADARQ